MIKLWGLHTVPKHSWWAYEENFRWRKLIFKYSAAQSKPHENSSQFLVLRSGAAEQPSSSNTAPYQSAHFKDNKLLDYRRHGRTAEVLFNTYRCTQGLWTQRRVRTRKQNFELNLQAWLSIEHNVMKLYNMETGSLTCAQTHRETKTRHNVHL